MSVLLDPPSDVLLLGPADADGSLRDAIESGDATSVRVVETTDEVAGALDADADGDVGCVVLVGPEPARDESLLASIRARDEDLPIVVYDEDGELAGPGRCAATPSGLRDAVDDALSTAARRRRQAEESEMLGALLDQLGKSIYFKDDEARILHHADVGGGPDPERVRGMTDLEIYPDRDLVELSYEDDMRVVDGERVVDREERIPGDDLWMRTTKVPWRDEDGEVKGIIGHTVDVTEYKRQEHRLEELRHRFNTFTSQLRHELKTQLQIAMGNLGDGPGSAAWNGRKVRRALAEIDRVVEDYDTLAKQSVTVGEEAAAANLRETVAEAWATIDADGIDLTVDVPDGTYVNAPSAMVRTVIENLLRDFVRTATGATTLRVGTTDDGFYVENGAGEISDSKRAVVEQPGFAAAQDGSGRELSLVKDEMDKHVWSLSVDDDGEGSGRLAVENCLIDVETPLESEPGRALEPTETAEVGSLTAGGRVERDAASDRWYVAADGEDVFRHDNDFFFVYTEVTGRACVRGRVRDVEEVADWSKGGFMIRDDLSADATYAYVGQTPKRGTELLWRTEPGRAGESRQLEERAFVFDWYRLERDGEEVRTSVSIDGHRWQEIDRRLVASEDPVYVGMVVCSTRDGDRCEAVFEDVTVRQLEADGGARSDGR